MQGGLGASASAGVSYTADSGLEFPSTFETTFVAPSYGSDTSFQFNSFSLDMGMTGTENFVLSFLGVFEVDFDVALTGETSYFAGTVASSRFAVNVHPNHTAAATNTFKLPAAPANTTTQQLRGSVGRRTAAEAQSDTASDAPAFVPGDEVEFMFTYEDFEPNELTVVMFSLTNGVRMIPLLEKSFITSASGSGEQAVLWNVPFDPTFAAALIAYGAETDFIDVWAVQTVVSNIPSKKMVSAETFSLLPVWGNTTTSSAVGDIKVRGMEDRLHSVNEAVLNEPGNTCAGTSTPGSLGFKVDFGAAIPSYSLWPILYTLNMSDESNLYKSPESCVAGAIAATAVPSRNPTAAPSVAPTITRPSAAPTTTTRPSTAPTTISPSAAPTTITPTVAPTENDVVMFEAQQVLPSLKYICCVLRSHSKCFMFSADYSWNGLRRLLGQCHRVRRHDQDIYCCHDGRRDCRGRVRSCGNCSAQASTELQR